VAQYRAMLDDFLVCSLHVHVHLPDRELAVRVGNHLRPWLPLLVALSANSPFHQGNDTGYADWRAIIRSRFPCLGPPPYAESLRHHEELATAMADSGAMLDAATPFWDIRPNPRLPTVEVRSMDVPADIDDTVALAALVRALVATATDKALAGDPGPRPSSELLRAAYWRAARDGWSGCGVDALTGQILAASVQTARLVDYIGPALHRHDDTGAVHEFVARLIARGTGADLQRVSLARHGTLAGVVDDLVRLRRERDHQDVALRRPRWVTRADRRDAVHGPAIVAEKQGAWLLQCGGEHLLAVHVDHTAFAANGVAPADHQRRDERDAVAV
jgi:glutamate---cysteine ligase / carboxylate-amine ligase